MLWACAESNQLEESTTQKKKHPINLTVINDICMYYEAPNMIKLEIFILLAFPLKRREREKKIPRNYIRCTHQQLLCNSPIKANKSEN